MEGGRWWNQAFEAIGYKDAFQVKLLPEDADPLDVRYHVIQWVHRSTRGWSYGASIADPRTGEILKGHVSLGSLRIRQDFLIAQALMNAPFAVDGSHNGPMLAMALARIRQLAAHEIGHTLGFAHNYAASARANTSVMDYPHPQVEFKGKQMDFSHAYDTKIGDWDKVSVDYAYGAHKSQTELNQVLDQAYEKGLRFITDADARNPGGAHIYAHLWDNGTTIVDELKNILTVRQKAIANFSVNNIRPNETYSHLEDVFVPLYFLHRYQTEAVSKIIGGSEYNYAVRGGKELVMSLAPLALQIDALRTLTTTLDAQTLAIPKEKLALFPPRAFNYDRTRESFKGKTGITFDPFGGVEAAADFTLDFLLHPDRLSRLAGNKAVDAKQLGVAETLQSLTQATIFKSHADSYLQATQETINFKVLSALLNVLNAPSISPLAAAEVQESVQKIRAFYGKNPSTMAKYMVQTIDQFKANSSDWKPMQTPNIPDGAPIGMDCLD
jgi:hypothetical protein